MSNQIIHLDKIKQDYINLASQLGKRPNSNEARAIYVKVRTGKLSPFNISTWDEFVNYCGYKPNSRPMKFSEYKNEEALNRQRDMVKTFFEKHDRAPFHREFRILRDVIYGKYWEQFGIVTWNQFLTYCELPLNVERNHCEEVGWYDNSVSKIQDFFATHGRSPTTKEMPKISYCISSKKALQSMNIRTWGDFLKHIGLPVNWEIKWKSKDGLLEARNLILQYHENKKIVPYSSDFPLIAGAISNGSFKQFGIKLWLHMLRFCGLEPRNHPLNFWNSGDSVILIFNEINKYYEETNKTPTIYDIPNGKRCATGLSNGKWEKFGLNNWSDVLLRCGLKPNITDYSHWKTEQGFNESLKHIQKMASDLGRPPYLTEVDDHIAYLIHTGEWRVFNVEKFYDLIIAAGLEPGVIPWARLGKEGLELAKRITLQKNKKLNRTPLAKENSKVICAISAGRFEEFNIHTYHEFLTYCGLQSRNKARKHGKIKPKGYWDGKRGLKRGKNQVLPYIRNNQRLPSREIFSPVYTAAKSKKWIKFGIHGQRDFQISCIRELISEGFDFNREFTLLIEIRYQIYV
ncbi:MAG: hypothetical protein GPJ54_01130 [Candidatus Heimdallarchaeota archaeon]|nr:hypothetical protein [Candidatus Heimdallarchaeota archaeon]